ncbi:MAG: hypothetical protein PGN37_01145 [Mycobacterium kyogaense]|uniref:hypothetical protein n=1 Tax=Mycobacterium kyogaense TaxID=2212479 RepID=UPI002FFBC853
MTNPTGPWPDEYRPRFDENQPVRKRGRRGLWVIVGAILITTIAAAAVFVLVDADRARDYVKSTSPGTAERQVSGDRDDWTASVCQEGSVTAPSSANFRFPNATTVAYCSAKAVSPGSVPTSIMIAQWPASVAVGEELSKFPEFRQFAAGPGGGEAVVFAPVTSADRSLLEPLTAFGFTIVSLS